MAHAKKIKAAIIGSGNIGTDLLKKIQRSDGPIECVAFVGIDPDSDGLRKAAEMGVPVTHEGVEGLLRMPEMTDIKIVFDATCAGAHRANSEALAPHGVCMMDLTPAAIGPFVVPVVNLDALRDVSNVNMVTCGGQATIPIVAAISKVAPVHYGEIVASISSRSAGPGTRANIDEFTETTSRAIEIVGGAKKGKAIIVINPAEPPLIMRDTVFTLTDNANQDEIRAAVADMVAQVQSYVPGYRLKQQVQFEVIGDNNPVNLPEIGLKSGLKTTVFLEVEGAGDYLPNYAGNLDIMTAAALATAERIAIKRLLA
ncbi:acetaldehyde dehydrogenase (acetylating) [uncultured Ruegeria sp.]|uniref:acetaldehyde dehydrogenase (acetylating) n=1 Tax=uncultured Ruegeria sp. TaxID=259304 RepID=UPI0026251183|nr:acetaldehyde dehydrogenase (acetylating) [uncultured Ruegeria sp.]